MLLVVSALKANEEKVNSLLPRLFVVSGCTV